MILPRTGDGLPPWRRRVSGWMMSALRALIAWIVVRSQVSTLVVTGGGFVGMTMGAPIRYATLAALVAGAVLFTWSRTVLAGFALLAVGLGVFEYHWRTMGMGGDQYLWSLAVLAVLAAGEWLVRRVQRRLYSPPGA
jgi:hypothetical protein